MVNNLIHCVNSLQFGFGCLYLTWLKRFSMASVVNRPDKKSAVQDFLRETFLTVAMFLWPLLCLFALVSKGPMVLVLLLLFWFFLLIVSLTTKRILLPRVCHFSLSSNLCFYLSLENTSDQNCPQTKQLFWLQEEAFLFLHNNIWLPQFFFACN